MMIGLIYLFSTRLDVVPYKYTATVCPAKHIVQKPLTQVSPLLGDLTQLRDMFSEYTFIMFLIYYACSGCQTCYVNIRHAAELFETFSQDHVSGK